LRVVSIRAPRRSARPRMPRTSDPMPPIA
jgi:hypothetical protein